MKESNSAESGTGNTPAGLSLDEFYQKYGHYVSQEAIDDARAWSGMTEPNLPTTEAICKGLGIPDKIFVLIDHQCMYDGRESITVLGSAFSKETAEGLKTAIEAEANKKREERIKYRDEVETPYHNQKEKEYKDLIFKWLMDNDAIINVHPERKEVIARQITVPLSINGFDLGIYYSDYRGNVDLKKVGKSPLIEYSRTWKEWPRVPQVEILEVTLPEAGK